VLKALGSIEQSVRGKFLYVSLTVAALCVLLGAGNSDRLSSSDPNAVKIVTSDIPHFWRAFDDATLNKTNEQRAAIFNQEYFIPGSDGLKGFIGERLQSPEHLAKVTKERAADYMRIRQLTEEMRSAAPFITADFERFKNFYPDATFPNIYFVIGAWNSGGTSVPSIGVIVGSEILAEQGLGAIPGLVTHETVHWNQDDADDKTLLSTTLIEGSADFLAELADGRVETDVMWQFGCSHERALWDAFKLQMTRTDDETTVSWLYSDQAPMKAPAFVGYWIGYRIVQAYYNRAIDKRAAISEILHIRNPKLFLAASGYAGSQEDDCKRVTLWSGK
jgi:hypothetical protein